MYLATREDLLTWIANGENSSVEFKRDDVSNDKFAREVVAFANSDGGVILLGVDDDGSIAGVAPGKLEEWVMTACRDKVAPPIVPHFQRIVGVAPGRDVAVVRVERSYTAHHLWHNSHRTWLLRVGSQSREASQEELARLLQRRQVFRCDAAPIQGTSFGHLDRQRLRDYFVRVRDQPVPDDDDVAGWRTLLANTEILDNDTADGPCTLAGLLLFGTMPSRWLPQSGIDVAAYAGTSKDYAAIERQRLRGPMVGRFGDAAARPTLLDAGVIEEALAFVRRTAPGTAHIAPTGIRHDIEDYPVAVVREALVNALVHRDYLMAGPSVELTVYADRLEVISPGQLPNGITLDRMRTGCRFPRNPLLRDVLQDYKYLESQGMGVPRKIIAGMLAHNGKAPEFEATEHQVVVRVWK